MNVTISSQHAGIYNEGGTITSISNTKISGSSYGIYNSYYNGGGTIDTIDNVEISNAFNGIDNQTNCTISVISNSTITGCSNVAILNYGTIGTISNVTISDCNSGINSSSGSTGSVTGCYIYDCTGTALNSIGSVSDTTITNCTTGIYNSYSLSNVSVTDCTTALRTTSSSATFNFLGENTFEGNSYAIYNASYGFTLTSLDADGNVVDDSTVNLTGTLSASTTSKSYGYITFDSGNYTLNEGSLISAYSLNINEDASLTLTGDINFTITDNYITNNGTLTLTSGTLDTLIQGDGEIVIAEGGSVSANADYLGNEVSNDGSLSLTSGTLAVLIQGDGEIVITEGGSVSANASYIGTDLTNNGTLTLTGGTLSSNITNLGTLVADASYLGGSYVDNNYGTISLTGGTLETSLASIGGTIEVATGAEVSSSASFIDSALTNKGTLTLTGTSTLNGSITNSGTINADISYLGSAAITNTAGSIFGITSGTITTSLDSYSDVTIQIAEGGVVSSSATNIDTALTNDGTLTLTSGTLGAAITGDGSIEIAADNSVSTDAAYLGTALTNNGTLELTGGTLSSDITMAEGASLSTTEAVTLTEGASVSSTSITLTGTSDGTTANITEWSGDSISDATISNAQVTISSSSSDDSDTTTEASTQSIVSFSLVGASSGVEEEVTTEGASFTGVTFSDTAFILEDGSTLTLTNVSLDADCSITVNDGATASIDATNLTLTTSDFTIVDNTISISSFDVDGALTVNLDGDFTVNLDMSDEELAEFQAILAAYDSINFVFDGLDSYEEVSELNIAIFDNSGLDVSEGAAYEITFTGSDLVSADGSLNISTSDVIPEPSTATLSLLALTALLTRRKRRATLC